MNLINKELLGTKTWKIRNFYCIT